MRQLSTKDKMTYKSINIRQRMAFNNEHIMFISKSKHSNKNLKNNFSDFYHFQEVSVASNYYFFLILNP